MKKERMNIGIALNREYYRYTYVMLYSLFENNPESEVHVYVLNSDLTQENIAGYSNLAQRFGAVIYDMKLVSSLFENLPLVQSRWPVEIYYRLALVDILPEEVDRLLYLDADVIVNKSLYEMYHSDMKGTLLKACKSHAPGKQPFTDIRKKIFEIPFSKGYTYFNSGVLLMNLKEMRGQYHLQTYLDALTSLNMEVVTPDQDILNWVHWQEVEYMDEDKFVDSNRYNLVARYAASNNLSYEYTKEEIYIIHYAGDKPWNGDALHYYLELIWWEYAKKTPYYDILLEEFLLETLTHSGMNEIFGALRHKCKNLEVQNMELKKTLDENIQLKKSLDECISINEQLLNILEKHNIIA